MTFTAQIAREYITSAQPDSDCIMDTYTLTTDHAASSYEMPVLVGSSGIAYGPMDTLPNGEMAHMAVFIAEWDGDASNLINKFNSF
jgi:ribosome biogenesis protein Tsr3